MEQMNKWLLVVSLPVIIGLFFITASSHFGYTPDDTFIYLQFAKNVAHGDGISFNAGQPTYGITSPLWLFIIAAGGKMGVDLFYAAKVIDLLFASLALIVFYLVAYEIIRDIATAICATVAFSMNAWLLRWAGTGLESSLALILVFAVILFCLRNEYFVSIFFVALATLVRPETSMLVLLIIADLYINSFSKRRAMNTAAALILVYVAILAPWFVYAYKTFGAIVPNTAFAKSGFHLNVGTAAASITDIAKTIGVTDGIAGLAMIVSGFFLVRIIAKHRNDPSEEVKHARFFLFRQSMLGLGWLVILPAAYILGDVNVVSRYLLLVTPLIIMYAFLFLHKAFENSRLARHVYTAVFVLTALIMLQNQMFYRNYVKPGITIFEHGMTSCLVPIATWFRENTPPGTNILAADIGALGYYSDRNIRDAAGLTSTEFLPLIRQGNSPDSIIGKSMYRSICSVDYVVDRTLTPGPAIMSDSLEPVFSRPFYGLSLGDPRMTYYTVYRVRKEPPIVLQ